ncbi:hypothetical protein [Thauera humireducens]|uniref:hypothetical protein n=1 Tax=Thauera humireducens TaxID=1134435 RepID=UPI00312010AF
MLISIEKVLTKDEVRQFRQHLDQAQWEDGLKTAGTLASQVKRNLQLADGSDLATRLGNHILRKLGVTRNSSPPPCRSASTRPSSTATAAAAPTAPTSTAP